MYVVCVTVRVKPGAEARFVEATRLNHEGTRAEDAIARVRQGMRAMLRLGSAWYDVAEQVKAVTESGVDPRNFHAKFLVRILCDADGKRLFSDDDVELLSGKSASVLDRLYDVGASLAGLLPSDAERLAGN